MRTRKEVVELIGRQMDRGPARREKPTCWHYGIVELRELLDFIYGGPPENEDEELRRASWRK